MTVILTRSQDVEGIKGRTFVLTGKMRMDRFSVSTRIHNCGGFTENRCALKVDYLVQADQEWGRETTKTRGARNIGIPVVSERALFDALNKESK